MLCNAFSEFPINSEFGSFSRREVCPHQVLQALFILSCNRVREMGRVCLGHKKPSTHLGSGPRENELGD